ncbi:lytic transglycosylase domain-containing protein [Phenylobacterium sp.]|uniref:lytic transglycosylase domain-containing protein n=1 Tax=Phenylobacterium sp. TaxID=1871053 RepID=UPI00286D244F|nr:lytic transglycosylase domain-containing protein [Phenylobacterium sp.]
MGEGVIQQGKAGAPLGILALGVVLWASPAWSDVLEIAPDGAVVVYAAPTLFNGEGARSLTPEVVSRPARSAAIPARVTQSIFEAAARHAVSPHLVEAVAWRESRFRQAAVSAAGAVGVMQLMDGTARDLGVDRYDLDQNINGGAAYLSRMLNRYGGDIRLALAAYNAGPGAVDRHRGVPPFRETQAYVAAVLSHLSDRALIADPVIVAGR